MNNENIPTPRTDKEESNANEWSEESPNMAVDSEFARQLERELHAAQEWKASAMKVMEPLQEIGKVLNLSLGSDISPQMLPAIRSLQSQVAGLREALKHVDAEIAKAGNFYEEGDEGSAIAIMASLEGYANKALSSPAVAMVPWEVVENAISLIKNLASYQKWGELSHRGCNKVLTELQSYAPSQPKERE